MKAVNDKEEGLNVVSHLFGFIFFLIGAWYLLGLLPDDYPIWPYMVYLGSAILLFLASTAYHWVKDRTLKGKLRIVDHICIYYLIAGSFTPICYFTLGESRGTFLLYLVWGIALTGTILKIFFTGKYGKMSLVLYALMGWLIVADMNYLLDHVPLGRLFFIVLGGFFYMVGIYFYANKKLVYNHFIWHLFVLAGAISHWYFYVMEFTTANVLQ